MNKHKPMSITVPTLLSIWVQNDVVAAVLVVEEHLDETPALDYSAEFGTKIISGTPKPC